MGTSGNTVPTGERVQSGEIPLRYRKLHRVNLLLTISGQLALQATGNWGFVAGIYLGVRIMDTAWTNGENFPGPFSTADETASEMLVASCLAAAAQGDLSAYFDLGVVYSTGSHGVDCDLIEAHKWFNLAAVGGYEEAAHCRADISEEMTAREISEAQRRAREWLAASSRRAA